MNFVLIDKIPVSAIKLFTWRFQTFLDVSLFEKLILKSYRPQNKTLIRGASPGLSYKLRNKDAIGERSWYIATQERPCACFEVESARKRPLAAHGVGCPAAGLNIETRQPSRHYIAEILLNVTLNHNQRKKEY